MFLISPLLNQHLILFQKFRIIFTHLTFKLLNFLLNFILFLFILLYLILSICNQRFNHMGTSNTRSTIINVKSIFIFFCHRFFNCSRCINCSLNCAMEKTYRTSNRFCYNTDQTATYTLSYAFNTFFFTTKNRFIKNATYPCNNTF
jgi:hypothetical protein